MTDSNETSNTTSKFCVVHNEPLDAKAGDTFENTPEDKLQFLVEQRDKCLDKLEEFANTGAFKHSYHVYHHPPAYTCEDVKKLCPKVDEELKCAEMKNLFLYDKKKKLYLISALVDTEVNLKEIGKLLGAKDLRLANEEKLKENLNLLPGSVTPFSLMNDGDDKVKFFLDKKAIDTCDYLGFHPNSCISTVAVHKEDFLKIIEDPSVGNHQVTIIDM